MNAHRWLMILIPVAYLLGSIPFGLIVGLARGIDPRKSGSGNIGATNLGRLLGGKYFALVFILDLLKSFVPMLAAGLIIRFSGVERTTSLYVIWLLIGFASVIGHMFPVFLGFKGGKGVATSTGLVLGLYPYYTLPAIGSVGVFLAVFFIWRYVSLASIASAAVFPLLYAVIAPMLGANPLGNQWPLMLCAVVVSSLIIYRHRTNIARLRAGTEHRFARKVPASV